MKSQTWVQAMAIGLIMPLATTTQAQDFLKKLDEKVKQAQQALQNPGTAKEMPKKEGTEQENLPAPKKEAPPSPFVLPDEIVGDTNKRPPVPPPPSNPNAPQGSKEIIIEESQDPGYLGLVAEKIPGGGIGLIVSEITQGSPAWKAGFQVGDRILAIAGTAVTELEEMASQLQNHPSGRPIKFLISRNGRTKDVTVVPLNAAVASRTQPMLNQPVAPLLPDGSAPVGQSRAVLGLSVANLSDYFRRQFGIAPFRGAAVTEVAKGSPAELVGVKPGDCVVEIDGQVIQSANELQDWLRRARPGQVVTIGYYRGRGFHQGQVILAGEYANLPPSIDPGMLTPDYVMGLQSELDRVRGELDFTQRRLLELEQRLRLLETPR